MKIITILIISILHINTLSAQQSCSTQVSTTKASCLTELCAAAATTTCPCTGTGTLAGVAGKLICNTDANAICNSTNPTIKALCPTKCIDTACLTPGKLLCSSDATFCNAIAQTVNSTCPTTKCVDSCSTQAICSTDCAGRPCPTGTGKLICSTNCQGCAQAIPKCATDPISKPDFCAQAGITCPCSGQICTSPAPDNKPGSYICSSDKNKICALTNLGDRCPKKCVNTDCTGKLFCDADKTTFCARADQPGFCQAIITCDEAGLPVFKPNDVNGKSVWNIDTNGLNKSGYNNLCVNIQRLETVTEEVLLFHVESKQWVGSNKITIKRASVSPDAPYNILGTVSGKDSTVPSPCASATTCNPITIMCYVLGSTGSVQQVNCADKTRVEAQPCLTCALDKQLCTTDPAFCNSKAITACPLTASECKAQCPIKIVSCSFKGFPATCTPHVDPTNSTNQLPNGILLSPQGLKKGLCLKITKKSSITDPIILLDDKGTSYDLSTPATLRAPVSPGTSTGTFAFISGANNTSNTLGCTNTSCSLSLYCKQNNNWVNCRDVLDTAIVICEPDCTKCDLQATACPARTCTEALTKLESGTCSSTDKATSGNSFCTVLSQVQAKAACPVNCTKAVTQCPASDPTFCPSAITACKDNSQFCSTAMPLVMGKCPCSSSSTGKVLCSTDSSLVCPTCPVCPDPTCTDAFTKLTNDATCTIPATFCSTKCSPTCDKAFAQVQLSTCPKDCAKLCPNKDCSACAIDCRQVCPQNCAICPKTP